MGGATKGKGETTTLHERCVAKPWGSNLGGLGIMLLVRIVRPASETGGWSVVCSFKCCTGIACRHTRQIPGAEPLHMMNGIGVRLCFYGKIELQKIPDEGKREFTFVLVQARGAN